MQITVNGNQEIHDEGLTVSRLLEKHNLTDAPCAVELNKSIVPRKDHAGTRINQGDQVEIVTLVGGG
ncbi:MAG: sulfur carrier protein ThiS [Phycisphaeraceae bacterium]|nr:MAG: sulfur carrier protein ThiS [Phycisphaeraceae bacterium]